MKKLIAGLFFTLAATHQNSLRAQTSDFNPCPPGETCSVMPLGDSITFGIGSSDLGGYRTFLLEKAWAQGKSIQFVGDSESGPDNLGDRPFPRRNEGHSGFTIENTDSRAGISELIVDSLNRNRPHIVLLMIGTNDVATQFDLDHAPERLGRLLDKITSTAPNALVVVAKIVPSRDDAMNERIRRYNDSLGSLVQDRMAAGQHLALVDMYDSFVSRSANFKSDFLQDDLHPSNAGFSVMSGTWYEAIGHLLH